MSSLSWVQPEELKPRAEVGQLAPFFESTCYWSGEFRKVGLHQFRGKFVCLFFYPKDFSFVCPTEILAFHEAMPRFHSSNCQVLGVSTDSKYSHYQYCQLTRNRGGLGAISVPLLSDPTKAISCIYGCLIRSGVHAGSACRATFIIDYKGILRHASYSVPAAGRNVEECLRLVQAFQAADKSGGFCPPKWKAGDTPQDPGSLRLKAVRIRPEAA